MSNRNNDSEVHIRIGTSAKTSESTRENVTRSREEQTRERSRARKRQSKEDQTFLALKFLIPND